jgi:hypothetical protein
MHRPTYSLFLCENMKKLAYRNKCYFGIICNTALFINRTCFYINLQKYNFLFSGWRKKYMIIKCSI